MEDLQTANHGETQRHIIQSTSKVIHRSVLFEVAYPVRISNSPNVIIFLRVSKGALSVFCRPLGNVTVTGTPADAGCLCHKSVVLAATIKDILCIFPQSNSARTMGVSFFPQAPILF